jgi:hypothetical protein
MAAHTDTYFCVSPSKSAPVSGDQLCEYTWCTVVYTDAGGNPHLVLALFAFGIFNLWSDYVSKATLLTPGDIAALPAVVQAWLTKFSYDPTSFDVYKL